MALRERVPADHADYMLGIDTSRFQGDIDWNQLAAWRDPETGKKISFAYIRSSGSEWVDRSFREEWREAKAVGIHRGPYIALHAETSDARTHFNTLLQALGGEYGILDLPPAIDIEKPENPNDAMAIQVATVALELADIIRAELKKNPIIYTGAYFHFKIAPVLRRLRPDLLSRFDVMGLWTPDYGQSRQTAGLPEGWTKKGAGDDGWTIHQYTSSQRLPGITANTVDMNVFDGGPAVFAAWRVSSARPFARPAVWAALATAVVGCIALYGVLRAR